MYPRACSQIPHSERTNPKPLFNTQESWHWGCWRDEAKVTVDPTASLATGPQPHARRAFHPEDQVWLHLLAAQKFNKNLSEKRGSASRFFLMNKTIVLQIHMENFKNSFLPLTLNWNWEGTPHHWCSFLSTSWSLGPREAREQHLWAPPRGPAPLGLPPTCGSSASQSWSRDLDGREDLAILPWTRQPWVGKPVLSLPSCWLGASSSASMSFPFEIVLIPKIGGKMKYSVLSKY